MILLNEMVEVLATPPLNVLPLRVLPPQKPKGQVALLVVEQAESARKLDLSFFDLGIRSSDLKQECESSADARSNADQRLRQKPYLGR
jgi:hypothetical protein